MTRIDKIDHIGHKFVEGSVSQTKEVERNVEQTIIAPTDFIAVKIKVVLISPKCV